MDSFFHIQGTPGSPLAPLILIHAVSGFALPYLSLGPLSTTTSSSSSSSSSQQQPRPVYGLSSPIYESKSYRLPASFAAVAREYVEHVRKEIPKGPYVLGGWSMGGMIAVKMAEMLEEEGEEVLGVVLIDSANPVGYPAFRDQAERAEVAEWTYRAYAGRSGLPGLEEMGGGGEEEEEGGGVGDGEDVDVHDEEEEEEEEVDVMEYLPRMRKHIYNSLDLIARAGQGGYLPKALRSPVTLVKCTQLATLPGAMSEERKKAIRLRFEDERAGWAMEKFKSIPVHAMHDDVFDSGHVGEVMEILRGVLGEMR